VKLGSPAGRNHTDANLSASSLRILQTCVFRLLLCLERLRKDDKLAAFIFEQDPSHRGFHSSGAEQPIEAIRESNILSDSYSVLAQAIHERLDPDRGKSSTRP